MSEPIPYARQSIDEEDIAAVLDVLRSDWLTTGPKVGEFEEAFAARTGSRYAVAFSSGTASLHAAVFAAGLGEGDAGITSPLTFAATANCLLYVGASPLFADVREDVLTLDPAAVAERITPRTKAILPVDYAGHPADLDEMLRLAAANGAVVIEDACHALGAQYCDRIVGSIATMTVFSFHPVKHITTGEGGMVTTDDPTLARRLRLFRNHGVDSDSRSRAQGTEWRYEMIALGYNYRLSDVACALGLSQLGRLDEKLKRRSEVAAAYASGLAGLPGLRLPHVDPGCLPAWHLYPVRVERRDGVFRELRARGIGVNVHYPPVHLHPYYRARFGYRGGEMPVTEGAAERLLSLPMFHGITDEQVDRVIAAVCEICERDD